MHPHACFVLYCCGRCRFICFDGPSRKSGRGLNVCFECVPKGLRGASMRVPLSASVSAFSFHSCPQSVCIYLCQYNLCFTFVEFCDYSITQFSVRVFAQILPAFEKGTPCYEAQYSSVIDHDSQRPVFWILLACCQCAHHFCDTRSCVSLYDVIILAG